jgi:hypothetical protein
MYFRSWLESLELTATVQEPINPYLSMDRNNPQAVQKWQKFYTQKRYRFPLAKDSFIHFTLIENIPSILQSNRIGKEWYEADTGVFAVSTSFGKWVPIVQFNHIISRKAKTLSPLELRTRDRRVIDKLMSRGYRLANHQEEIGAIRFTTSKMPQSAHPDEVVWLKEVPFASAMALPLRQAIAILKHTPHQIEVDSYVEYH